MWLLLLGGLSFEILSFGLLCFLFLCNCSFFVSFHGFCMLRFRIVSGIVQNKNPPRVTGARSHRGFTIRSGGGGAFFLSVALALGLEVLQLWSLGAINFSFMRRRAKEGKEHTNP